MANYSTFTADNNWTIDSFPVLANLPASQYANAILLNQLRSLPSPTSDQIAQINSLTTILQNYNISPDQFNAFSQALVGMEGLILNVINFQDKGTWLSGTTYSMFNIVEYNGQTYMSKQNNNLGNIPVGGSGDSYFSLIAKQGATGAQGIQGIQGPAGLGNLVYRYGYSAVTAYSIGDTVLFGQALYYCILATSGGIDPSNSTYWQLFLSGGSITVATSAPSSPGVNQIFINSTTNIISFYNGTTWIPITTSNATATTAGVVQISSAPTSGTPIVPSRVASTSNFQITSTSQTTIATFTPSITGNFDIKTSFRVVTGTTNVTIIIGWTDSTGAQTNTQLSAQSCAINTYSVPTLNINAVAGQPITIKYTSSIANYVYASGSIVGV